MLVSTYYTTRAGYYERVYGDNVHTTGVTFSINPFHELIVLGNSLDTNYQTYGYYILKTDTDGNVIWQKNQSDVFNKFGAGITNLFDGRIVILGTHSGALYQAVAEVQILDSAGNTINSSVYPPTDGWGTSGTSICNTADSSVLITFYTDGFISTNFYSIYQLNTGLSTEWSDFVSFDGSLTGAQGLTSAPGNTNYTIAYYDLYIYSTTLLFNVTDIRKHDGSGLLVSDSLYGFNCTTNAVSPTFDNGAIICGIFDTLNHKNLSLIRLDSSGNVLFQKQYFGIYNEESADVIQTYDSGFVMLSTIEDSVVPGQHDVKIQKMNASGDSLWSKQFGGYLDEHSIHIEEDGKDLVIMAATSSFGDDHIYIIRADSAGVIESPFTIVSNGRYFCENDTETLFLNPSLQPGQSVAWSNGDTTDTILVSTAGNYFAVITDTLGNSFQTPIVPVYFAQLPNADFGADTIGPCTGSQLHALGGGELTNTYQWYLNGVALSGETYPDLLVQQTGRYQLVVSNYCMSDTSMSYIDTIYQLPAQPVITSSLVDYVCEGDSLFISVNSQPNVSYQWYTTDQVNAYILAGAVDSGLFVYSEGNYLVEATNSNGCSIFSLPYTVQYDLNAEFINPNGPPAFCEGGQVELSVSSGSDYHWSNGDTTPTLIVDTTGQYFVSFINQYGCPKNSDTITITVLNNPVVDLGNDTVTCLGSTIILDAGPGFNNYFWNDGSTGQTLNASVSGTSVDTSEYYVFVTDTNGCTDGDTVTVYFDLCESVYEFEEEELRIWPNPSAIGNPIFFQTQNAERKSLLIFDIIGREIFEKTFDRSVVIPGWVLPGPGLYVFRIFSGKDVLCIGKLIIQ